MSRPMWVVYEVRSNSWSSPPNTISTCSTELRSPSSRLSTRLRTSRPPSWASAQWSVAPSPIRASRCWKATVSGPSSWTLAISSFAPSPRMTSVVPVSSDCPTGARLARWDEHLDEGCFRILAELDDRARDQAAVRGAHRPADVDGLGQLHAVGHAQDGALVPRGAGQLGEAIGPGSDAGSVSRRWAVAGSRAMSAPSDSSVTPAVDGHWIQLDAEDRILLEGRERRRCRAAAGSSRTAPSRPSRTGGHPRARRREGRHRCVYSVVRLDRERAEALEGGAPIRAEPLGLTGGERLDEGRDRAGTRGPLAPGEPSAVVTVSRGHSPQRPLHLQLHQAVELDGVLHRQLLGEDLEEALHDEVGRLVLGQAAGSSGRRPGPR